MIIESRGVARVMAGEPADSIAQTCPIESRETRDRVREG
jgi:hypothetical protein